jgi:hypothetical protein
MPFEDQEKYRKVVEMAKQAGANVDKILYLPKSNKTAPKKAADPEKGKVAAAAIGSIDFSL